MRVWLSLILAWSAVSAVPAEEPRIVIIQLKDGTRLEGEWRGEDAAQVMIEIERAGGTIRQTREIPKTEIAELADLGPEDLAQRKRERTYAQTQRYQLNPAASYTLEYYDQVIQKVLRPFLEQYPDAPQAEAVAGQLNAWQAERQQVSAGRTKFRGQWLPQSVVTQILEEEARQKTLQQAQTMLQEARLAQSQGRFEPAVAQLRLIVQMSQHPDLVRQAETELKTIYPLWLAALEKEQADLAARVQATEAQAVGTQSAPPATRSLLKGARDAAQKADTVRLGQQSGNPAESLKKAQAHAEAVAAQQRLPELRNRLAVVEKLIPQVRARCEELKVVAEQVAGATAGAGGATVAASTEARKGRPADMAHYKMYESPLPGEIADFFRKFWPHVTGLLVLIIWFVSRRLNQ